MQRRERRPQVVRYVRDELAPVCVGALELFHLLVDDPRHPNEGLGEPVNLIAPLENARRFGQLVGPALAAAEPIDVFRQSSQAPRQKMEGDERDNDDEKERKNAEPSAQAQNVAPENHLRRRIIFLACKDDVNVALQIRYAYGRHRKYFPTARVARVVAEDRERLLVQESSNRLERDALANDASFWRGERQDRARGVEQIELDARVDDHEHVEHIFEHGLVYLAVRDQYLLVHEVLGEILVQLLLHFLEMSLGRVDRQGDIDDAEGAKKHQRDNRELGVERARHSSARSSGRRTCSPRPRLSGCSGDRRDRPRSSRAGD